MLFSVLPVLTAKATALSALIMDSMMICRLLDVEEVIKEKKILQK